MLTVLLLPVSESSSQEETFLQMLKEAEPYESIAAKVSPNKNLELEEHIDFIEKNGFKTYGVIVKGPKREIVT
jgi:hypothetical protein